MSFFESLPLNGGNYLRGDETMAKKRPKLIKRKTKEKIKRKIKEKVKGQIKGNERTSRKIKEGRK